VPRIVREFHNVFRLVTLLYILPFVTENSDLMNLKEI